MMLRFVHRHLPVSPWPGTTVHQESLIWSWAVLCFVCLLASCFQLVSSHLVLNVCLDCSVADTCPSDLSVIIVMPVLEQCPWRVMPAQASQLVFSVCANCLRSILQAIICVANSKHRQGCQSLCVAAMTPEPCNSVAGASRGPCNKHAGIADTIGSGSTGTQSKTPDNSRPYSQV